MCLQLTVICGFRKAMLILSIGLRYFPLSSQGELSLREAGSTCIPDVSLVTGEGTMNCLCARPREPRSSSLPLCPGNTDCKPPRTIARCHMCNLSQEFLEHESTAVHRPPGHLFVVEKFAAILGDT